MKQKKNITVLLLLCITRTKAPLYLAQNFNARTVDVCRLIGNFIPHFTVQVIIYTV